MPDSESRDRATIRALNEIDPDLGGLFEWGRRLCSEADRPGLAYLIAHVGRELTNGLIRQLRPSDLEEAPSESEESEEDLAVQIANAFGLAAKDPRVRSWAKTHRKFAAAAHARVPGPAIAPLRPAFEDLAKRLFGAFGEYFHTQTELDEFIERGVPTDESAEQLRTLLMRPVQRRRFFSRLLSPAWIGPLARAGFFQHPPERLIAKTWWKPREWPEGDYLTRMASAAPQEVAALLRKLTSSNDNPTVWIAVASAIQGMPGEDAATLVPVLGLAIRQRTAHAFSHEVLEATAFLASAKRDEAFALIDGLLWPGKIELPPQGDLPDDEFAAKIREVRRPYASDDRWVVPRLEDYTFDRLLDNVVPALEELDRRRTLDVLIRRLHQITYRVLETDAMIFKRLRELDGEAGPIDVDALEIDSRRWCRSLVHDDIMRSVRARLAQRVFKAALEFIRLTPGPESVLAVVALLEQRNNEILRRMVLALLAEATELNEGLQEHLDAFLASDEAVEPPFGAVESAALLRSKFELGSAEAQAAFISRVESGPDASYVSRMVRWAKEHDTRENRESIVADWQRLRLRWFHNRLPSGLRELADRLGLVPAVPDARTQALDEIGSWSQAFSRGAPPSPMSAAELRALSPTALGEYLRTWSPPAEIGHRFERPSVEGLETAIRSMIANDPAGASDLKDAIARDVIPFRYVRAIAEGLRSAAEQDTLQDVSAALRIGIHLWRTAAARLVQGDDETLCRWSGNAAVDLIRALIERGLLSNDLRDEAWLICHELVESDFGWNADRSHSPIRTFRAASHASFSYLSARITDAFVSLAWSEFMEQHPKVTWPPPGSTDAGRRMTTLADIVLARRAARGPAAEAVFGEHIGLLLWMAQDWTIANLGTLFDGGIDSPGDHPSWATYIERHQLNGEVFRLLRTWYAYHAAALPGGGRPVPADPDDEVSQAFVLHVGWATLFGRCKPGDSDQLVERTFERSPVKAKTHLYWSIWRNFEDDDDSPEKLIPGVVAFWDYRLGSLEATKPSDDRDDEVDGLCQLIAIRQLPAADAIRLGARTATLLRAKQRVTTTIWERLEDLVKHDAAGAFPIAERLIGVTLEGKFTYLPFDEVSPILRAALAAGGEARERARVLLHRIGSKGLTEYGVLWTPDDTNPGDA